MRREKLCLHSSNRRLTNGNSYAAMRAAWGSVFARSVGRSAPSFPRKTSPTLGSRWLRSPNVSYLERYVPFILNYLQIFENNYRQNKY